MKKNFFERLGEASRIQFVFLIFLVGFFVYLNSLFNGFVWDDEEQILKNPLIQNFKNLPLIFRYSTFYGGGGAPTGWFYRPMMTLSYLLNYSLWGPHAFGFHLFQIFLHLLNSALVFLVFEKIFLKDKFENAKILSFFLALFFAVHPGNVEAVSYIAALQEVLYTFFALFSFFLLNIFEKKNDFRFWLLAGSLLLFSLFSKEAAIFLIPLVFFFLFLFQKQRAILWFITSLIVAFFYFLLRLGIARIPFSSPNVGPVAKASLKVRLLTLPYEIFSYLRVIFFPKDLFICQHALIAEISDFRFWGYLLLLGILAVFWIWTAVRLKSMVFYFFSFWFLGSLGLVLNILPLDMTVAERWLYFPLIGFLGMVGVVIGKLKIENEKLKIFALVFGVLLIFVFGLRTIARNFNWRDGLTLYSYDIRLNPGAFDLQNNYGVELFRAGKIEEAKTAFERSIALYPRWWFAYNNLGAVYERLGDFKKAEELYRKTLEISDYYLAYENLGFLLFKTDKTKEAISFLEEAILKFPKNSKLKLVLALAYYKEGERIKAKKFVSEALSLEPSPQNKAVFEAIFLDKEIPI